MHKLPFLLAALAAPLAAQTSTFTTPKGFDSVPGNATFFHWNAQPRRMQVVDNTNKGIPKPSLKQIAFRRASAGGGNTSGPRTFMVTLLLGNATWGTTGTSFDANYKGTPTTVHARKSLNVPDWTQPPTNPPAPFDLIVPFDAPYTYLGLDALVWDLTLELGSGSGSMDRQYVAASTRVYSTALGTGCVATDWATRNPPPPMNASMSADNAGTGGIGLQASTTWAPVNSFPLFMFDTTPRDIPIPGLCANLRALPIQTLTGGPATTTSGYVPLPELRVPYDQALEGVVLYMQTVALDPGQTGIPLVVSNGASVTVPSAPPPGTECCYLWQTPLNTPATFVFFGGAPLAQFSN
jgi:hypothetical protein